MLEFLVIVVVLCGVVALVGWPLRRREPNTEGPAEAQRDLEAAREAKYREIRDAEMDHLTGKLSDADYEQVDGALRAEAVEILHKLDQSQDAPQASGSETTH
jgi:hypothetical protein